MSALPKLRTRRALMGASAAAMGWALATAAVALPQNPVIFANSPIPGSPATFNTAGNTLTVTQNAERVVIDWDSFNISSIETVNFVQPSQQAIVFNRVDPAAFTTIGGALNGNGGVWLFSPGGLLFSGSATVNTGSFVASLGTLDDFQANASVSPSATQVFINWGPAENLNSLQVDSGATIFSSSFGFIVLQASHIDMDGQVGGNGQQVGYIVSEGASIEFQQGTLNPNGWELVHASQASDPAGRGQPYFNHTGTTLSDFIQISGQSFTEANFDTVINLDGVMDAAVGDADGVGITVNSGHSSISPTANGSTTSIVVSGDLSSGGIIHFDADNVNIDGSISANQFESFGYGDFSLTGSIETVGQAMMHVHGDDSDIDIDVTAAIDAGGIIDISATNAGTYVFVDGDLTSDTQVNIRSGGDVHIGAYATLQGDADNNSPATAFGINIVSGAGFNTATNTSYISAGDLIVDDGAQLFGGMAPAQDGVGLTAHNGDISFAGDVFGSVVQMRASGHVEISGGLYATDAVALFDFETAVPGTGDGITLTGDATLQANDRIVISAHYGDIVIESGATLRSDADDTPTVDLFTPAPTPDNLAIISNDAIVIESGVTIDVGANLAYFNAHGVDESGFTSAAIDISSDVDARSIVMLADNGSIRIRDGAVMNAASFFADANKYFVLEDGASIAMQIDPEGPQNPVAFPYADFNEGVYVTIIAQDMALYGDISAPGAIVLTADTQSGYTYLGGVDGGANLDGYDLGAVTFITDAEFQNLHAPTVVVIAGSDGNQTALQFDSDITVRDLTVNGDEVQHLVLGTSTNNVVFITGEMTATGSQAPDLTIGFAAQSQASPLLSLRSFVPGNIAINGSIGSLDNPFGQVTLIATGDIGMGTEDFLEAAVEDPEFNAAQQSSDFDVDEGHLWVSAEGLSIATPGRVIQQNTGTADDPAGLAIGAPSDGNEVIFLPEDLDGLAIGGAQPFTLSFGDGPSRVELFGVVHGENAAVEGRDVSEMDFLIDADLDVPADQLFFNDCQFGGGACGGTDEVPRFETPTDVVAEVDTVLEPADDAADDADKSDDEAAEDQDSKLFRALVAPGADRAYEQERMGDPITGSGNEDLWTGSGAGDRP